MVWCVEESQVEEVARIRGSEGSKSRQKRGEERESSRLGSRERSSSQAAPRLQILHILKHG